MAANPLLSPTAQTPAQIVAHNLTGLPNRQFTALLASWSGAVNMLWKNPRAKPADILAALGTNAGPLFDLSVKTAAFLEEMSPGCTAPAAAAIKPTTLNQDGTVTVNP